VGVVRRRAVGTRSEFRRPALALLRSGYLMGVLEHTAQSRACAQRLDLLLALGGSLALTTLNRRPLARRVFGMRWSMVLRDHFTYWDRRFFRSLFTSLGLTVREDTMGLGRDFVEWVDRVARFRRPGGGLWPGDEAQPEGLPGGWDTSPGLSCWSVR
jgi:hypothetical protein